VSIPYTNGPIAVTAAFTVIPHCLVPNLRGKTLVAAEGSIISHGCSVGRITRHASRTVKKRHVSRQNPNPGTELTQGGKVNLVVSKGRR
jgi:beta-lactam-binding protein with PASTA domain